MTGKRAFKRDAAAETMTAIWREGPPDLMGVSRVHHARVRGLPQETVCPVPALLKYGTQTLVRGEGDFMKYLCLVYGEEKDIGAMTDDECMAYDNGLRDAGRWVASEALQPARTARVVRVRDGKVSVRDGPFAETKELLAGFYPIDAADLNEAVQLASQIPPARVGTIEVRPVRELTSTKGERRRL